MLSCETFLYGEVFSASTPLQLPSPSWERTKKHKEITESQRLGFSLISAAGRCLFLPAGWSRRASSLKSTITAHPYEMGPGNHEG